MYHLERLIKSVVDSTANRELLTICAVGIEGNSYDLFNKVTKFSRCYQFKNCFECALASDAFTDHLTVENSWITFEIIKDIVNYLGDGASWSKLPDLCDVGRTLNMLISLEEYPGALGKAVNAVLSEFRCDTFNSCAACIKGSELLSEILTEMAELGTESDSYKIICLGA